MAHRNTMSVQKKTGMSGKNHLEAPHPKNHSSKVGIKKTKSPGPKATASLVHSRTVTKKAAGVKASKR